MTIYGRRSGEETHSEERKKSFVEDAEIDLLAVLGLLSCNPRDRDTNKHAGENVYIYESMES